MKIKLNSVEFDVRPVPSALREVLLSDEVIAQGVLRDVWRWDHGSQSGEYLVQLTPQNGVPLGNGISFFVPKAGASGRVERADAPTSRMGKRFLEGIGAKSMVEVMQGLNKVAGLAQRQAPLARFAALNAFASYRLRQHVDFAVVQLSNTARNLTAYFLVPGQVVYASVIDEVVDQAAHDAAVAAEPDLLNLRPGIVLPTPTQANLMMRRLAMLQRLNDLKASMGDVQPGELPEGDPRRQVIARLAVEWRLLAPKPAERQAANGAATV